MFFVRQGATHKVVIGPAVAVGDGFTPVTTLAISSADEAEAILHDNGTVVDISGYTFAAITTADGYYHLTLQSGISGTVGHMTIVINDDSLCLPIKAEFTILEEAVYDRDYKAAATGVDADWTNAGRLDTLLDAIKAVTDLLPDAGALDDLAAILTDTGTTLPATLAAIIVFLDTEIAAILADTGELQTDWTNGGRLDLLIDAIKAVTDNLPNSGSLTDISTSTDRLTAVRAAVLTDWINGGRLDLIIDATLADTDELQTDWADGGRLDVILDAASAPTAAAVADAVWDEARAGHVTAGTFGFYLDSAISGVGGAVGPGATSCTLTIKDGSNNALQDAEVWASNDAAGNNVVAGTLGTNAQGEVTFMLDPGTYYRWVQKAGYNFTNPQPFTVT